MQFSTREYQHGDRVLALFQRELGSNELLLDMPYYENRPYVLAEGVIAAIGTPYGARSLLNASGSPVYSTHLQLSVSDNDRVLACNRFFEPHNVREILGFLHLSLPGEENRAKREFLGQFALPVVVGSNAYVNMLRDLARAVHPDAEPVIRMEEMETLVQQATEFDVEVARFTRPASQERSNINPVILESFRTWERDGFPTTPFDEPVEADEPSYDDEEEEDE